MASLSGAGDSAAVCIHITNTQKHSGHMVILPRAFCDHRVNPLAEGWFVWQALVIQLQRPELSELTDLDLSIYLHPPGTPFQAVRHAAISEDSPLVYALISVGHQ
jgi:hypothetical protein